VISSSSAARATRSDRDRYLFGWWASGEMIASSVSGDAIMMNGTPNPTMRTKGAAGRAARRHRTGTPRHRELLSPNGLANGRRACVLWWAHPVIENSEPRDSQEDAVRGRNRLRECVTQHVLIGFPPSTLTGSTSNTRLAVHGTNGIAAQRTPPTRDELSSGQWALS
jgi:hypothetical protein